MGKNTVQVKQLLDKWYSESALSRQMVEKWFANCKRGCTNTDDAERSSGPNSVVVPEKIKKSTKWFWLIVN